MGEAKTSPILFLVLVVINLKFVIEITKSKRTWATHSLCDIVYHNDITTIQALDKLEQVIKIIQTVDSYDRATVASKLIEYQFPTIIHIGDETDLMKRVKRKHTWFLKGKPKSDVHFVYRPMDIADSRDNFKPNASVNIMMNNFVFNAFDVFKSCDYDLVSEIVGGSSWIKRISDMTMINKRCSFNEYKKFKNHVYNLLYKNPKGCYQLADGTIIRFIL